MAAFHCGACRADVVPVRPGVAARVALVVALVAVVVLLVLSPLLGVVLFTIAPLVMLLGMGLGPLVDAATTPPTCPHCGRRVVDRAEVHARAAAVVVAR